MMLCVKRLSANNNNNNKRVFNNAASIMFNAHDEIGADQILRKVEFIYNIQYTTICKPIFTKSAITGHLFCRQMIRSLDLMSHSQPPRRYGYKIKMKLNDNIENFTFHHTH